MDFETLNRMVSVALFAVMIATLFGTVAMYVVYKRREAAAKRARAASPVAPLVVAAPAAAAAQVAPRRTSSRSPRDARSASAEPRGAPFVCLTALPS